MLSEPSTLPRWPQRRQSDQQAVGNSSGLSHSASASAPTTGTFPRVKSPTHSGEKGHDGRDQEKREKEEEQNLRDAGRGRRDVAKAQKTRDNGHHQKQKRPEEHAHSSFFTGRLLRRSTFRAWTDELPPF